MGEPMARPLNALRRSTRVERDPVSNRERIAAAQARVAADKLRGIPTEQWIVDLAKASA